MTPARKLGKASRALKEKASRLVKREIPSKVRGKFKRHPFLELARPYLLGRSLLPFMLGVLAAGTPPGQALTVVLAAASLSLLWSGLYALNDYADRGVDALNPEKKSKPIPSRRVRPFTALLFGLALAASGLWLGRELSEPLFQVLVAMALLQWAYSFPPLQFKKRVFLDLVQQAFNPVLRFACGWVLFSSAPLMSQYSDVSMALALLFTGTYAFEKTKKARVEAESRNRFRNTVSFLGVVNTRILAVVLVAYSIVLWLYAFTQGSLNPSILAVMAVATLPFLPFKAHGKRLLHKTDLFSAVLMQSHPLAVSVALFLAWLYGLL